MTANYKAPHFILAAIQRIYPDLSALVGADWAAIQPQVDAHIAKLEATPNAYLTSIQLVDLLAQYEPARQRLNAEIKTQAGTSQHVVNPLFIAARLILTMSMLRNRLRGTTSQPFQTGSGKLASIAPDDDERRGIGQVTHDVAPDAALAFHAADSGQANFAQGIFDLEAAGVQVLTDDIIFLAEPMFQYGVIAQAVDAVVADGIPYFSSAGNDARQAYESFYEELSEQETSVLRGMIQAGKVNLTEADILLATNKEREQRGLAALSMTQVQQSLNSLEKVGRIEKNGDKYRIIEGHDSGCWTSEICWQ
ncbi:MAG TPA: hypothetical protein VHO69_06000 [Phototrophicaceae bacterium]|nr:hypothetical protein [Phototrophicaceae bacterium]